LNKELKLHTSGSLGSRFILREEGEIVADGKESEGASRHYFSVKLSMLLSPSIDQDLI